MLVLSRKLNEQIQIGENITVTILRVKGNTVRVGIDAPRSVRVIRSELPPKTDGQTGDASDSAGPGIEEGQAEEAIQPERFPRGPVFAALMQISTNAV